MTENGNRYDIVLVTDQVVEVKYWREEYASAHVKQILDQVEKYQKSGKPVRLELGRTKTDPITKEFIDDLIKQAADKKIPLKRGDISFYDLE